MSRFLKRLSPSLYPVISFLLLILTGSTILTLLPTQKGPSISFIDALFMITSASCVTGLTVFDIGTEFTLWGQLTLLACIQLGGLGIMTFSTVMILALGYSISFRSRFVVQDIFAHSPQADFNVLLRQVLLFTAGIEAVGTLLLFLRFKDTLTWTQAWYSAVFHAISAFCNAGFSLFSNNLMGFRGDILVSLTITTLIILGGIGFMVLHELVRASRNRHSMPRLWNQLSLHSRIVLSTTGLLLSGGTIFFLACEWSNTLKGLPLWEKLLASYFQSVTPRTAGFNTLDYGLMNNITLLGTIMLMFIGASPGSTGGGVKTSTIGVFMALSRAHFKGSDHAHVFKRSIPEETVNRAFSTFVVSVVIVVLGTAGLLISESTGVLQHESRGQVIEFLFETTSAFGTVGLSMGITPNLSSWSKFILVLIMFTGRLGPLVIATAIQPRGKRTGRFYYAEERIMIG